MVQTVFTIVCCFRRLKQVVPGLIIISKSPIAIDGYFYSVLLAGKALRKQQNAAETTINVFIMHVFSEVFCLPLSKSGTCMLHCRRRDGRVDYCGCLENSWVNRPGGSNPSPSVKAMTPETNKACSSIVIRIAVFVVDSCIGICSR